MSASRKLDDASTALTAANAAASAANTIAFDLSNAAKTELMRVAFSAKLESAAIANCRAASAARQLANKYAEAAEAAEAAYNVAVDEYEEEQYK